MRHKPSDDDVRIQVVWVVCGDDDDRQMHYDPHRRCKEQRDQGRLIPAPAEIGPKRREENAPYYAIEKVKRRSVRLREIEPSVCCASSLKTSSVALPGIPISGI